MIIIGLLIIQQNGLLYNILALKWYMINWGGELKSQRYIHIEDDINLK